MVGHTRSQHVRNEARHRCWPKQVVETFQPSPKQVAVHIEEEIVDVLHGQVEVLEPERERERQVPVEASGIDTTSLERLNVLAVYPHSASGCLNISPSLVQRATSSLCWL